MVQTLMANSQAVMELNCLLLHISNTPGHPCVSLATATCALHEMEKAIVDVLEKRLEKRSKTLEKNETEVVTNSNKQRKVSFNSSPSMPSGQSKSLSMSCNRRRRKNVKYSLEVNAKQKEDAEQKKEFAEKHYNELLTKEIEKVNKGQKRLVYEDVILHFAALRKLSLIKYTVGVHYDNFSKAYQRDFGVQAFSESLFYLTNPINHAAASQARTGTLTSTSQEGGLCFLSSPICIRLRMNRDIMITDYRNMYHFVPNHGRGFFGGRGGGCDPQVEVMACADW